MTIPTTPATGDLGKNHGEESVVAPRYSVVIPTAGRSSLRRVLTGLAAQSFGDALPGPKEIVVVDDRVQDRPALERAELQAAAGGLPVRVVRGHGRGPAHARNRGWRLTDTDWVCFLDDDVQLRAEWGAELADDLRACDPDVGATQGRLIVPLPSGRPTDWERNTAALEEAMWATADMAYRREALVDVDGFDERFPRAFREDADLALRVRSAGWRLTRGRRCTLHPVRPAGLLVSARVQAGNGDDALMRRLHGPEWRRLAAAPAGTFSWHVATVSAAMVAVLAAGAAAAGAVGDCERPAKRLLSTCRSRRQAKGAGLPRWVCAGAIAAWGASTSGFAVHRLAPGPRPADPAFARELCAMSVTSVLIPPLAVGYRLLGTLRHRHTQPWRPPARAVLFDRDGTLVHDVPYNVDPEKVAPVKGAKEALRSLRAAGLRLGVVSNQSAIGRGLATPEQVDSVEERITELLGNFDTWRRCPHTPDEGCRCRKPTPQLIHQAAKDLRVRPDECVVIGDIGSDVEAALAAGARPVLVPTSQTLPQEIADAPWVATDLAEAAQLVLAAPPRRGLMLQRDAEPVRPPAAAHQARRQAERSTEQPPQRPAGAGS